MVLLRKIVVWKVIIGCIETFMILRQTIYPRVQRAVGLLNILLMGTYLLQVNACVYTGKQISK